MRRPRIFLPLLVLLSFVPVARGDLGSDINQILRDKYLAKADVGIAIARVDSDKTEIIYRLDSDIPLIPASNLKLLTTSAFLDHFGPDFKFRTLLLLKGGDLYLIGDGDPTLGDAEFLKKVGWETTTVFRQWAEELKKRNITAVRNVIVDDSVFDDVFVHPHWLPKYASARYSAEIGGVNLNANCVDFLIKRISVGAPVTYFEDPPTQFVSVRNTCVAGDKDEIALGRRLGTNEINLTGMARFDSIEPLSVTIHDAPLFAATVLRETLERNGVSVSGAVSRDRSVKSQTGFTVVAALETKLATVLERANKDSMNLYAECLCKRLGHEVSKQPGSWENGPAAVKEFLKRIGIPEEQFHLDDGCGLARQNNVSADALVKVLAHNFHSPNRDFFMQTLAVGGMDGTFKGRFKDMRGRIFGKSGYVDNVSCLSGYLKARDERWYVFSILMNKLPAGTNPTAKQMQERVIEAIDSNATK